MNKENKILKDEELSKVNGAGFTPYIRYTEEDPIAKMKEEYVPEPESIASRAPRIETK